MPRRCCVPGCRSNYPDSEYTTVFFFPHDDDELCAKWVRQINRKDFKPSRESVVCIKHFDERYIVRVDSATRPDGSILVAPRKVPKLGDGAYPTIFENQPKYLTTKLPPARKDPSERQRQREKREDEKVNLFLMKDQIKDYDDFKLHIQKKLPEHWFMFTSGDGTFLMKYESSLFPEFAVSLKVSTNLSITVWEKKMLIPPESLAWLLGSEQKCLFWSTFDSLLSHLNSYVSSGHDKIKAALNLLTECEASCSDECMQTKLQFCCEQLILAGTSVPRYSTDTLLWACLFYFSHPSAYEHLRRSKKLTVPHSNYLRKLLQSLGNLKSGLPSSQFQYLKEKNRQLTPREKLVGVLMDEIYVKPEVSYKGGRIEGNATNTNNEATTVQVFMISSIFSKNKDVVGLYPVRNQTANDLFSLLLSVMKALHETGYTVVYIAADNNRVNRKVYEKLGNGKLLPAVANPLAINQQIFLLFDTVHLLKSIRNNWLNQQDTNQTFFIPPLPSLLKVTVPSTGYFAASISHLKAIYNSEKNDIVKLGPTLTRKALFPSSLERQNVRHALRLFDEKLLPALDLAKEAYGEDVQGTAHFIEIIMKWWKIVNTRHPLKGRNLREPSCEPVRSTSVDSNIHFLHEFCEWLQKWESLTVPQFSKTQRSYKLSLETYTSLLHTTTTLIALSDFLLNQLSPPAEYVLLGKFQTDSLEARFGQYRSMSGGNYHISVVQILESERKLKMIGLMKLSSSSLGEFEVKDFLISCKQKQDETNSPEVFDNFFGVLAGADTVTVSESNVKALIYISGYVVRMSVSTCSTCKEKWALSTALEYETSSAAAKTYLGF